MSTEPRSPSTARWAHEKGAQHMSIPTDQEVLEAIRQELDAIKVPGALEATPELTWQELDVDSLDLVELVKALEDRFDVAIADGRLATLESECSAWLEGGDRAVSPHFVPMMMPNAAAGTIAMRLGAHGPGFSLSSACATGAHAIGEAKRMIDRGEADVVVAGGTEAAVP